MELEEKNFSIRALSSDDWREFRMMRLMALKMHPQYFLWKYETVVNEPESFWRENLSRSRQQIFGLFDGYHIIGITGVFTHRDYSDGKTADFGMSFIEPAYRDRKLSGLLYNARIEWARENGFEKIHISHHADNTVSKSANQRFGFAYVGEQIREWPDGSKALDVNYELKL